MRNFTRISTLFTKQILVLDNITNVEHTVKIELTIKNKQGQIVLRNAPNLFYGNLLWNYI